MMMLKQFESNRPLSSAMIIKLPALIRRPPYWRTGRRQTMGNHERAVEEEPFLDRHRQTLSDKPTAELIAN